MLKNNTFRFNNDTTIVHDKNIAVDTQNCVKNKCINNCKNSKCKLCIPCMSDNILYEIREAYREHLNEGNFVRILPEKIYFKDKNFRSRLSYKENILIDWFIAKCKRDKRWC